MDYTFTNINAGAQIQNPQIVVKEVTDHMDGTASVDVGIYLGAPNSNAASFIISLPNLFNYIGDQPMKSDVEAWVEVELVNYES